VTSLVSAVQEVSSGLGIPASGWARGARILRSGSNPPTHRRSWLRAIWQQASRIPGTGGSTWARHGPVVGSFVQRRDRRETRRWPLRDVGVRSSTIPYGLMGGRSQLPPCNRGSTAVAQRQAGWFSDRPCAKRYGGVSARTTSRPLIRPRYFRAANAAVRYSPATLPGHARKEPPLPSTFVNLPLHCSRCGRPVTVEYRPEALVDLSKAPPVWRCPHHGCIGSNMLGGGVRDIIAVWSGHVRKPLAL
jgi:hypothetical protein